MASISFIIPVFNQWAYTEPCLQALARTIPAPKTDEKHEIILVDNGSSDETQAQLKSAANTAWGHAQLRYIRHEQNIGFNAASNAGAQASSGSILVFLNNDTVPQNGWIEGLLAALQLPKVGIVGPKLLFPETLTINHAGYSYNPAIGGFFPFYYGKPATFPPVCKPREFQALLGACLMMRREDFFALNQFSLDGLEDIDLCLKVRASGKRVLYTPRSEVWHHGGATFKKTDKALIPRMTNEAFFQAWPSAMLQQDDVRFYREDGYAVIIHEDTQTVELIAEHHAATQLLKEAQVAWARSEHDAAIELAKRSLQIYRRNISGLRQLSLWLVEKNRADEATEFSQQLEFLAGMR